MALGPQNEPTGPTDTFTSLVVSLGFQICPISIEAHSLCDFVLKNQYVTCPDTRRRPSMCTLEQVSAFLDVFSCH